MLNFECWGLNGFFEVEEVVDGLVLEGVGNIQLVEGGQAVNLIMLVRQKVGLVGPVVIIEQDIKIEGFRVCQIILARSSLESVDVDITLCHESLIVKCGLDVLLLVEFNLGVDVILLLLTALRLLLLQSGGRDGSSRLLWRFLWFQAMGDLHEHLVDTCLFDNV